MTAQETIGTILEGVQPRDAIHFALSPVLLGQRMAPGSFVKFAPGSTELVHPSKRGEAIGMIDPFIADTDGMQVGSRVWMFLMPNTVTSLRHVWEHPAFGDAAGEPVQFKPFADPRKDMSEQWLRNFADRADCGCTYDELIALASGEEVHLSDSDYGASSNEGDYILIRGMDAHGEIPPEFWTHFQIVTGLNVPKSMQAAHFSCAC